MEEELDPDAPRVSKHDHPLSNFFNNNASIKKSKKDDELIDIHVGNPLKKITQLLEDIKNQKAFTFTLKGSLGIMGIALVIGSFGIFGGTKAFCQKGIQTKIGIIKVLHYQDLQQDTWIDFVPILSSFFKKGLTNRQILVTPDNQTYRILHDSNVIIDITSGYITGSLDSCANSITVENQNGIEAN